MKPKEEMKTMAMAGTGIINSQIPAAAKPYYAPAQATLGVSPTKADQYNSSNKRGSEFKKSAQHILNR